MFELENDVLVFIGLFSLLAIAAAVGLLHRWWTWGRFSLEEKLALNSQRREQEKIDRETLMEEKKRWLIERDEHLSACQAHKEMCRAHNRGAK